MRKIELLAPAGSYETFRAFITAGADAVYLGGSQFGARAYANNFSEEEAHRYMQKRSMDNGTGLAETAQMILSLLNV